MSDDSPFGYVIDLGTKEYPGPLYRRRVNNEAPPLDPDLIVYDSDVYEPDVYVDS